MRPAGMMAMLAALAAVTAGAAYLGSDLSRPALPEVPETADQRAANPLEPARRAENPAGPPARGARAIAPSRVAIPPVEPSELQRVPPRGPLSELSLAGPSTRPERLRLFRPLVPAAGIVAASGFTVTLAGIEPPHAEMRCTDDAGVEWPCGMRARTAFRGYLRGRAVECAVPPDAEPGEVTAACTLAGRDPAVWLVKNGWAFAATDDHAALEDEARAKGEGMFGAAPPVFGGTGDGSGGKLTIEGLADEASRF